MVYIYLEDGIQAKNVTRTYVVNEDCLIFKTPNMGNYNGSIQIWEVDIIHVIFIYKDDKLWAA